MRLPGGDGNPQSASGFVGGKYYIWDVNVSGNVTVTLTSTAGHGPFSAVSSSVK